MLIVTLRTIIIMIDFEILIAAHKSNINIDKIIKDKKVIFYFSKLN